MVGAEAIIEHGILSTTRVVELTDQLAATKKTCLTYEKKHETEVAGLNDLASQRVLLQQKTADTLKHASRAVVSLVAVLKRVLEEFSKVPKERDELRENWKEADRADKGWSNLAKKAIEETRGLSA